MILDMIQGCRYLRRSTDRWLLSKNSTTRLKGLESWHGAGLLWNCSIPITKTKGSYLYPGSNTTPSRPWLQHLLPKMASCPSRTRHQFIPSSYSRHVITHSRMLPLSSVKQLFCRHTPVRRRLYRMLWGKSSAEWRSFTKLGPQVSLFSVPIFGANTWASAVW
jgi:hypothetical protein